jgi:hypothetical protein
MDPIGNGLFPCIALVATLVVIFLFLAYSRHLRHREIMYLAEKGLAYPEHKNGKVALRWGIVITGIGLALVLGLLPFIIDGSWELLLLGLLPTFFGISLVLIYVLTRTEESEVASDKPVTSDKPVASDISVVSGKAKTLKGGDESSSS